MLRTEVLILMHPQEVGHAKNTGRLLHLCLPNSRVLIGDVHDERTLAHALFSPWDHAASPGQTVLLYPGEGNASAPSLHGTGKTSSRIVIIDATWRKSRQLVAAHPRLEGLPRIALEDPPPTRYAIRKAHAPHQLSTLEAARLALGLLEPESEPQLMALNDAMAEFVALQRPFWPHARPGA